MNNDNMNKDNSGAAPPAQERNVAQDELRLKEFVRAAREAAAAGEEPAPQPVTGSPAEAPKPAAFQPATVPVAKPAQQPPVAAKPALTPQGTARPSPVMTPSSPQQAPSFRAPSAVPKPVTPAPAPSAEAARPAVPTAPATANRSGVSAQTAGIKLPIEQPPVEQRATSVIASGTTIVGKIKTEGNLEVMGVVEGNIEAGGDVLVRGRVTGNIKGAQLELVSCQVKGMLTASAGVAIDSESTVLGDVTAESVVFDGKLKGNINAEDKITLNSNSYLVGDIKSKTITIGTGAVINGQIKTTAMEEVEDVFEKVWPTAPSKKSAAERKGSAKSDASPEPKEAESKEPEAEPAE